LNVIKSDGKLTGGYEAYPDEKGKKLDISLIGDIATSLRFDARFGKMCLARKLASLTLSLHGCIFPAIPPKSISISFIFSTPLILFILP
jgi:hypothetical protein